MCLHGAVDDIAGQGGGGVGDYDDDAGFVDGLKGAIDAYAFDGVGGVADAGCVDEAEEVVAKFIVAGAL